MRVKHIPLILLCIALLVAPAAADVDKVLNGDFSNGLAGWDTRQYATTNSASLSTTTHGDYAMLKISLPSGKEQGYIEVYQTVDLTYVDELSFKAGGSELYQTGFGGLTVYIGSSPALSVDSTTFDNNLNPYIINTESYSRSYDVVFRFWLNSPLNADISSYFYLTDVSAISTETPPTYASSTLSSNIIYKSEQVSASVTLTSGMPSKTSVHIDWGDGSQSGGDTSTQGTFTRTETHTYSAVGTYTVTGWARNSAGATNTFTIGTVEVVTLDFSAYPTSGDPPLTVQFTADGSNIVNVLWDFGDGTTSTQTNPTHTYAASATSYTVTLTGYTKNGLSKSIIKENLITSSAQSVSWDKSTYEAGEPAEITWNLRNPDFTNNQYTLQILPSDSQGNIGGSSSVITPYSITTASGTHTIDTTGYTGYYTAAVFQSGSNIPLAISTANIYTQATLTVNLAISGVTYTNATTVTLSKDGAITQTNTTSTGQAQFTVPTGTYLVSAATTGYAAQTATVNLLTSAAITIDFVTGTSQTTTPSGSGSSYASTFITFRCMDELTGMPLSGVSVKAIGVKPTSPVDWIANLFGAQWGEQIIDTEVSGYTDSYGAITFPMFLSIRYTITATYEDQTKTIIMTPSSLQSEYIIQIESMKPADATEAQAILTSVKASNTGNLTISYNDTALSTTALAINIYQKPTYNETYSLVQTIPVTGNTETISYQFTEYKGTDIKITINATSTKYGEIQRTYYHTFAGMLIDLGLPDNVYPWICVLVAIFIAGIATYLQAPIVAFAIVVIEWVFYFIGWASSFGPGFVLALILATLLSIAFYMSSRR